MSRRSYLLFLSFIWIALVYIIVAFTDITATAFVGPPNGGSRRRRRRVRSPRHRCCISCCRSSWACLLRYLKLSLWLGDGHFSAAGRSRPIWVGKFIPLRRDNTLIGFSADKTGRGKCSQGLGRGLLIYCLVAGMVPVWMLLQPRGQLGWLLSLCRARRGSDRPGPRWRDDSISHVPRLGRAAEGRVHRAQLLWPMLFIMVACGACSGFHSLIASGTTSKQLEYETDARSDRLWRDAAGSDGGHRFAVLRDDVRRRIERADKGARTRFTPRASADFWQ